VVTLDGATVFHQRARLVHDGATVFYQRARHSLKLYFTLLYFTLLYITLHYFTLPSSLPTLHNSSTTHRWPLYPIDITTSAALPVMESQPTLLASQHFLANHLINLYQAIPSVFTVLDL
jgi:hypothetical protein